MAITRQRSTQQVAAAYCLGIMLFTSAHAESMDNGFMFFDSDTQARVVSALTKEGVPFQIRSDGYVIYRPQDEARVSRIRLTVLNDSYTPNAHFLDRRREELFLARLKSEGIPFDVHVKKGDRWISWSERDDKRAEEIYRSVINPP